MKLALLQATRLAGLTSNALANVCNISVCSGGLLQSSSFFRVDLIKHLESLCGEPFVARAASALPVPSQVSTALCTRVVV